MSLWGKNYLLYHILAALCHLTIGLSVCGLQWTIDPVFPQQPIFAAKTRPDVHLWLTGWILLA